MPNEATSQVPAAPPVQPTPWSLMQKRRSGVQLTTAEKKVLSDYHKPFARQRSPLYLTREEKEAWEAKATAAGMRLGPWMRQQVHLGEMDKSPSEKRLEEEILRLTADRNNLRHQVGELATENAENTRKAENLVDDLRRLAHELADAQRARMEGRA